MKKLFFFSFIAISLFSCSQKNVRNVTSTNELNGSANSEIKKENNEVTPTFSTETIERNSSQTVNKISNAIE